MVSVAAREQASWRARDGRNEPPALFAPSPMLGIYAGELCGVRASAAAATASLASNHVAGNVIRPTRLGRAGAEDEVLRPRGSRSCAPGP